MLSFNYQKAIYLAYFWIAESFKNFSEKLGASSSTATSDIFS